MPTPLNLSEPTSETLKIKPLQMVVCQVRHDRISAVPAKRVLAISEELRRYPRMDEHVQQEINFAIGPTGVVPAPANSEQRGWRLRSTDESWTVALLPESFSLECTGYTTWTDFSDRFNALTSAVCQHLGPSIELRLGLRYVDSITRPQANDPARWRGLIDNVFLGPLLDDRFANAVTGIQQSVQLIGPDGAQVLLRHGTQADPAGTWPYIVDTDCYRSESRKLSTDAVTSGADALHRLALQVFQAVITPRLHGELLGRSVDGL